MDFGLVSEIFCNLGLAGPAPLILMECPEELQRAQRETTWFKDEFLWSKQICISPLLLISQALILLQILVHAFNGLQMSAPFGSGVGTFAGVVNY